MNHKGMIVGVVGNSNTSDMTLQYPAQKIGRLLVENNCIILTGGHHKYNTENSVKLWALEGALSTGTPENPARVMGIPPKSITEDQRIHCKYFSVESGFRTNNSNSAKTAYWIYIHTGFRSSERDPLNGMTPDALIALRGESGTPREVTYALSVGRPVIFLDSYEYLFSKIVLFSNENNICENIEEILRSDLCREVTIPEDAVEKVIGQANIRAVFPTSGFPTVYKGLDPKDILTIHNSVSWLKKSITL